MRLATPLVISLSLVLVTAGPPPFSVDVAAVVSKATIMPNDGPTGHDPSDILLCKRGAGSSCPRKKTRTARTERSKSTPGRVQTESTTSTSTWTTSAQGQKTGHFHASQLGPDVSFGKEHADWTRQRKVDWSKTSPFRFARDPATNSFLDEGSVDRAFSWQKGVCDAMGGCRTGEMQMKKYPWAWAAGQHAHPYYAKLTNVTPRLDSEDSHVAYVDHKGRVTPVPPQENDEGHEKEWQEQQWARIRPAPKPGHFHGSPDTSFDHQHRDWPRVRKTDWMDQAPFRFTGDRTTSYFLKKGDVDRSFSWNKGLCDAMEARGCRTGDVQMKKYPWAWTTGHEHPYYAKVSDLDPHDGKSEAALVDHKGQVTPVLPFGDADEQEKEWLAKQRTQLRPPTRPGHFMASQSGPHMSFDDEHSHWTDGRKVDWTAGTSFRFKRDRETNAFLNQGDPQADLDRGFSWNKGVCDTLKARGCQRGDVEVKKYPWQWATREHPYFAKVTGLEPPLDQDFNAAFVDHQGRVTPIPPVFKDNARYQDMWMRGQGDPKGKRLAIQ